MSIQGSNNKEHVLSLLCGRRIDSVPCFSGLSNVTLPGLESLSLQFHEVHRDPVKMAAAAATTSRLFGFGTAVVPFDLGVEASALGARVNYREKSPNPAFPLVEPIAASVQEWRLEVPSDLTNQPRIACVTESLGLLRADLGSTVTIGAWIPGPATLAMQLVPFGKFLASMAKEPQAVSSILTQLTELLPEVALAYRNAGADFITIHEMGGSPGVVGPVTFRKLVLPCLQTLIAALPGPKVVSICGKTTAAIELLLEVGADAISVDQLNEIAVSRKTRGPEPQLFGNIDPIGVLANGKEGDVRAAVAGAIDAGVDAVWPGCDLAPAVPAANMKAMVDETSGRLRKFL